MSQFTKDYERGVADLEHATFSTGYWSCPDCGSDRWTGSEPCPDCGADPEHRQDSSFSWSDCDICGSSLGGDRYAVIGWLKGARDHEYSDVYRWSGECCTDCLMMMANGEEPDADAGTRCERCGGLVSDVYDDGQGLGLCKACVYTDALHDPDNPPSVELPSP